MRFSMAVVTCGLVLTSTAQAAPLTGAARDALAGDWRANTESSASACGAGAQESAVNFSLEFAMTGGRIHIDDNTEMAESQPVTAIDDSKTALTLKLEDGSWTFKHAPGGVLIAGAPPVPFGTLKGLSFRHCVPAADRSAIHLTPVQAKGISSAMPGGPILIDSRALKGCKAVLYQYLDFDVVGPTGFVLHRWNSSAVGEKLADGGRLGFKTDEITDFQIEQADAIPGGYRFKITELIPPNGSRGDTTTITVNIKGQTATIPEWKRSYAVCTAYTP
jgi:hypothetical protein